MADEMTCPGCGARNSRTTRRCRICTAVINPHLKASDRGLAALRPDIGFGTSFEGGLIDRSPVAPPVPAERDGEADTDAEPAEDVRPVYRGNPEVERLLAELPPPVISPVEPTLPLWEPTPLAPDDEAFAVAATIVIDVTPRNGRTPPLLEFEVPHFDPRALLRDDDRPRAGGSVRDHRSISA